VRRGERGEPLLEGVARLSHVAAALEALKGQSLDQSERVLHAVVELVDEEALPLLGAAPLGDVAGDGVEADGLAGRVERQRRVDLPIESPAGLGDDDELVVGRAAVLELPEQHLARLLHHARCHEVAHRAADDLLLWKLDRRRGGRVAVGDDLVERRSDDEVVRLFEDAAEALLAAPQGRFGAGAADFAPDMLRRLAQQELSWSVQRLGRWWCANSIDRQRSPLTIGAMSAEATPIFS
jgi:hypothetical protein